MAISQLPRRLRYLYPVAFVDDPPGATAQGHRWTPTRIAEQTRKGEIGRSAFDLVDVRVPDFRTNAHRARWRQLQTPFRCLARPASTSASRPDQTKRTAEIMNRFFKLAVALAGVVALGGCGGGGSDPSPPGALADTATLGSAAPFPRTPSSVPTRTPGAIASTPTGSSANVVSGPVGALLAAAVAANRSDGRPTGDPDDHEVDLPQRSGRAAGH